MLAHFKPQHAIVFLFAGLFVSFALFTGCEKEVEKIVEVRDTITVRDTIILEIITVDQVNANPDSIAQGGSIELTVIATKNPMAGDLTYAWFAEAGEFNVTDNDTVTWKAPDDEGAYRVSVHVTDGEYIAVGSRLIGVGMYAPTVTPYYVGVDVCKACHSTVHSAWSETGHSNAWATLQESGHPQVYCEPCHTVDDFPASISGNAGYDDAPIAKYENVQCENCHSAGGGLDPAHPGTLIDIDFSPENCGKCHEGTHHPYITEWEESPHNFDPHTSAHGAGVNGGCQGCHEGVAASLRLADETGLATFYDGAPYGTAARDTLSYKNWAINTPVRPIVCQTCHDSHDGKNPGQVRTVADIPLVTANGESPIISLGGVGKLCMHCHHARRGPESQIEEGDDHFGPHASPQTDMVVGKSAYHGVAPQDFVWAGPSHLKVQNSCKTCHLNTIEYIGEENPAVTGHKFEPTVEACENCHGVITSFRDIKALDDFDWDDQVEGLQDEVEGLLTLLEEALIDSFAARGITINADELLDSLGSVTASSVRMREAGYNYAFVHDDKSLGIHNPHYCLQLLQQSYLYLTGDNGLVNAVIVRDDKQQIVLW